MNRAALHQGSSRPAAFAPNGSQVLMDRCAVDADNVWVFWETKFTFDSSGAYQINIRATDVNGVAQQEDDPDRYDGQNDWPMRKVSRSMPLRRRYSRYRPSPVR